MSPAGMRKSEQKAKERVGEGHYDPHEEHRNARYTLLLHWIPVSLKNRGRTMLNRKAGVILHYRDRSVQEDMDAIRAIWRRVEPRPPICGLRMEMSVTIFRPLSAKEQQSAKWNLRRGDDPNVVGLIQDALGAEPKKGINGSWYEDDRQVTRLVIEERRDCAVPSVLIEGGPR